MTEATGKASVRRRITSKDVDEYARLTDDFNPIHVDEAYAAQTPFGRPIVHGTLTLSLIWDLFDALRPGVPLNGMNVDVRFTAPVPVGETVTAAAQDDADGTLHFVIARSDGQAAVTAVVRRP